MEGAIRYLKTNPANFIDDNMWDFLKDHGQEADAEDVEALRQTAHELIGRVESVRAEQGEIDFSNITVKPLTDRLIMEVMALVLSGYLEEWLNERK